VTRTHGSVGRRGFGSSDPIACGIRLTHWLCAWHFTHFERINNCDLILRSLLPALTLRLALKRNEHQKPPKSTKLSPTNLCFLQFGWATNLCPFSTKHLVVAEGYNLHNTNRTHTGLAQCSNRNQPTFRHAYGWHITPV